MNIAVLKISGKALNDIFTNDKWISTISSLQKSYDGLIIVHGAGKNITEWSLALGHEVKFIEGQRVTDEGVMEVVAAVQAGVLNAKIISRLISSGINAVGLTGIDHGAFTAENQNKNLGYVGVPKLTGSLTWLKQLLKNNTVPVFSSICRDELGNLMNVNADIFTEVLASSLKAESVFFVSDVEGVKLNGCFKESIDQSEILRGIMNGEITDGMIPKLNSCIDLLNKGINKVWIGSKPSLPGFPSPSVLPSPYGRGQGEGLSEGLSITNHFTGGTWIVQRA